MPSSKQPGPLVTIGDLAKKLGLHFKGNASLVINSVSSFSLAKKTDLCFLRSEKYKQALRLSDCGAVIVPLDYDELTNDKPMLYSANPHLSFIQTIHILKAYEGYLPANNIHHSAIIDASAKIGKNVSIGANAVIGEGVTLGDNVQVGAGSIIEHDVDIRAGSHLMSNVTICFNVVIGENAVIQPGVVIGSDGFGLVKSEGSWIKIPHLGGVTIGNNVEIGANTTIDRGALDDTIIGQGVKIDNLIQIAHNVSIGDNTAIAACVAIAGSTSIGKNCQISGATSIVGHISIADEVIITAHSLVTKSIKKRGIFSSGTPLMENKVWHRNNARYKTLDKLAKTVSNIEKKQN